MPRSFDPSALFVRWKRDPALVPYKTEAVALDAVARGEKALWQTGFSIAELAGGGAAFTRLLRAAFDRGLAVTFVHRPIASLPWNDQVPEVYVLPLDQTWRISAIDALWQTSAGAWSEAAEAQQSQLLGYTAAQCEAWLASMRHQQAGFGCLTAYMLLDDHHRRTAVSLGKRALAPASELVGRELFSSRDLLRPDAFERVPPARTLARVGLAWELDQQLFVERKPRSVRRCAITPRLAQRVAEGIRTGVQFLSSRGWT